MRTYLVLDLETDDDPTLPPPAPTEDKPRKGPPAPVHCMVLCAGYAWVSHEPRPAARVAGTPEWTMHFEALAGLPERKILRELSETLTEVDPVLVTYGGHNFDGPVLAARSFRCGVPLPWYYHAPSPRQSARYRYSPARHLDLCDELADFSFRKAGLVSYAKACGMPGKLDEVDGAKVGEMMRQGRGAEVVSYCLGDVAMTVAVFLRRQLVIGAIDLESYRQGALTLVRAMNDEPRLEKFRVRVDVEALMLMGVEVQDAADDATLEDGEEAAV